MSSPSFAMHALLLNEDMSLLLLNEWIDYRSLSTLDKAITNHITRIVWLQRLRSMGGGDVNKLIHSHSSMRWLIARGLRVFSIKISSMRPKSITDLTFEGIDGSSLRHISLAGCNLITDTILSVIVVGEGCPLLQSINLFDCSSITDFGVSAVAHGCPLLQRIDLRGCKSVADVGVSALGQGCPVLQSIDLRGCVTITDVGVSALGQGCPLLQYINLGGCRIVTDVGVSALGQGCPLLQYITLGGCKSVTDVGVSALAHGCPLLQNIDLCGCRTITDVGVSALMHGCPMLKTINFKNVAQKCITLLCRRCMSTGAWHWGDD